jgi:hypothetical protein
VTFYPTRDRNRAIHRAYKSGVSLRKLAKQYGLKSERIRQIVAKEERNCELRAAGDYRESWRVGRVRDPMEETF